MRTALMSCGLVLWSAAAVPAGSQPPNESPRDAFEANRLLGRGINLGNALEAPREGEWGITLQPEYFRLIKEAGFDSVRIPIRWSAHAGTEPPYRIDPKFFERVDWAIEQALAQGLTAVINMHHYEEIFRDPDAHEPRLIALWRQIAQRYRERPGRLYFEILNEPHEKLTEDRWNAMFPRVLAVIRESNPRRIVIVGPGHWNNVSHLEQLRLPEDRMLIVTFHYYSPFEFTHQAASWVPNSQRWKGTNWRGTIEEQAELRKDFETAAAWAKTHRRPLFLGEFGAYSAADMDSRARWTAAVTREAERRGISSAYWEFASGFGAYDPAAGRWREPLLHALLPREQ
jgi:endoglucanase